MAQLVSISREGAEALRSFAESVEHVMVCLTEEATSFSTAFASVSDGLGEMEQDFSEIVQLCVQAVENAQEAFEGLPSDLRRTASDIDEYLDTHPDIDAS